MAKGLVCTRCGTTTPRPKTFTKGSIIVELFLWLMFLLPGLLYSVWRLSTRYRGCPACGSPELIPADSPRARALGR